jgi:hypothetical protein
VDGGIRIHHHDGRAVIARMRGALAFLRRADGGRHIDFSDIDTGCAQFERTETGGAMAERRAEQSEQGGGVVRRAQTRRRFRQSRRKRRLKHRPHGPSRRQAQAHRQAPIEGAGAVECGGERGGHGRG